MEIVRKASMFIDPSSIFPRLCLRARLRIGSAGDPAQQKTSHGDVDLGFGDAGAPLLVAHQAAAARKFAFQRRGSTFNSGLVGDAPPHLDDKMEEGTLLPPVPDDQLRIKGSALSWINSVIFDVPRQNRRL
jgi:hypothetical protein